MTQLLSRHHVKEAATALGTAHTGGFSSGLLASLGIRKHDYGNNSSNDSCSNRTESIQ